MAKSSVTVTDNDLGLKAIKAQLDKMDELFIKVGLQDDDKEVYPSEDGKQGLRVAEIGYINEFGTSDIPSRPFMRQTAERRKTELQAHIDAEFAAILAGKKKTTVSLQALGYLYQGWIQNEIREGGWVPNAPYTLKKKLAKTAKGNTGEPKPLIDTSRMIQSIRYILVDKNK